MSSIRRYYFCLLRKHLISWRMLAVVVISVLTMDTFMMPIRNYCNKMEIKMSPWGFALIWDNKYIGLCFLLIYIFAAAIFPGDRIQERYIIARIGVSKWRVGQAMYLVTLGWLYTFFLYVCQNILLWNVMEFISEWGLGWGTLSNSNVILEYNIYTTVPYLVISNYHPVYANMLVVIIMGLLLGMLGMLMFWLNFYSKIMGSVIASAVIFLGMAASRNTALLMYSPTSWIRLDGHYRITNTEQPTVIYIIGMLILLTLLFFILAGMTANQTQENGRRKG